MKLRRSEVKYEMTDASGYNFDVVCREVTDERFGNMGWSAVVQLKTSGSITPEDALKHLKHSAEAFLQQLEELDRRTDEVKPKGRKK